MRAALNSSLAFRRSPPPWLLAGGVLLLTAIVYWPVRHGGFFWVEKIWLHNTAWLRYGDAWKHLIFHGFHEWGDYFRPLVTVLFVAEDRLFNVTPGPMHIVSLGIHLCNTLLVWALSRRLCSNGAEAAGTWKGPAFAALLFGLHPALTEGVAWIACQFELVADLFMLGGLWLNLAIRRAALRIPAVAICFFLAACSKESAIAFLPLLFLLDWVRNDDSSASGQQLAGRQLAEHWPKYATIVVAGLAYLGLRYWSLGFLVEPAAHETLFSITRFQEVCLAYANYWRIIVWPMTGAGPIHIIGAQTFSRLSYSSCAVDFLATGIFLASFFLAWRRRPIGYIGAGVTISLVPVLHIIPIGFDPSLYHERYATTAIAWAGVLVPQLLASFELPKHRALMRAARLAALAWLALAVANIRITLPLWGDEIKTWQWVLRSDPTSVVAEDHLLSTYLERNDYKQAQQLADRLVAENVPCPNCMLNAASLALAQGDVRRAEIALKKVDDSRHIVGQPRLIEGYVLATGQLLELKGNYTDAEEAIRGAISLDPLDPQAQMELALVLARQGHKTEAHKQGELALSLFAPNERESRQQTLERALAQPMSMPKP